MKTFLDEKHNIVPPEQARWLVITKQDNKGNLTQETWVDLKER